MNSSQQFNSTSLELARSFKLVTNQFVLPFICFVGFSTNLINVRIFVDRKSLASSIYNYFMIHSVNECVYLLLTLVYFLSKKAYENELEFNSFYWLKFYEFYILHWFTSMLAIFMLLLEIGISLKRLFIIVNFRPKVSLNFWLVISMLFAISFVISLPLFFNFSIEASEAGTVRCVYQIAETTSKYNRQLRYIIYLITLVRAPILPIALLLVSIMIIVCMKRRALKHWRLNNRQLSETDHNRRDPTAFNRRSGSTTATIGLLFDSNGFFARESRFFHALVRVTKMLVLINCITIVSNFSILIVSIVRFKFGRETTEFIIVSNISNILLYLSHSFDIFFYLTYDKLYRLKFRALFA